MNIVKRFFQGEPVDSIEHSIMVPRGQLYIVRAPSSPKSENECLSTSDVVLSLKNAHLVVWQPKDGGGLEDGLDEDDEELANGGGEDEGQFADANILGTFNLKENNLICLFERYKQKIITWRDLEGDFGDMYEYRISSSVSFGVIEQFMMEVYNCLYELKYNRVKKSVDELQEFVVKRSDIELYMASNVNDAALDATVIDDSDEEEVAEDDNDGDDDDDDDDDDDLFVDASEKLVSEKTSGDLMNQIDCELYFFSKGAFKLSNAQCEALIIKIENWNYIMEVQTLEGEPLLQLYITENIYPEFIEEMKSFIFNQVSLKGVFTWRLTFSSILKYRSFQESITKAIWESKNKEPFPENDPYLIETFSSMDIDEEDEDQDEDSLKDPEEEIEPIPVRNLRASAVYDDDDEYSESDNDGEFNSGLSVGLNTDRAFVSRGDKLGVFKADDNLEFVTSICNIQSKNKKSIKADKMMLMNADNTMILQDSNSRNVLHQLDLKKGKVIQDFKMTKDGEIHNINVFNTNSKFSGANKEDTFLGATAQALFRIDQRVKDGFISNDEYKSYKTKLGITAMTTTIQGMVAIATQDGSIKLYDSVGKNAKTALAPLGDSIFSLDVSSNGRYLLATCEKYLLLINLKIKSGKYEGSLGFTRSFPVESKPQPMRLRIQPSHMASLIRLYGKDLTFTAAKFDLGSRTIISSIGKYSFMWDMKAVLGGNKYPINITHYDDKVVVGDFSRNVDQVLVALKNDVALTSRSAFKTPDDEFNVVKQEF